MATTWGSYRVYEVVVLVESGGDGGCGDSWEG